MVAADLTDWGGVALGPIVDCIVHLGTGHPSADDRAWRDLAEVDRRRLFVSGADSKHIRVYDARTGAQLRDYFAGDDAGFINDVIVTKRGAYFTDSNNAWLYFIPFGDEGELGELRRIPLGGDYVIDAGFNANGIVAARGGKSLIVVKSNTGELFEVDAATGSPTGIELTGGDPETVVGITRPIHSDLFQVPTTIARSGGRNYVVNAKFGLPNPGGSFEIVKVPKR